MAQSSPYDGQPTERLAAADSDGHLSCSHSIPPTESHTRLKKVSVPSRILLIPLRVGLSTTAGVLAMLGYTEINPSPSRHFKPLPPWSDEAIVFFTVFTLAAAVTYLALVRKWKRR